MREFSVPESLFNYIFKSKALNKTIGLVPTMGALHEGHLALIEKSKRENDLTVVSIFVNPLQFNNDVDLLKYPRTIESDVEILIDNEVDILFAPSDSEMYPSKPTTSIDFGDMAHLLEGEFRQDHFEGVGIVVSKLLNIIHPDSAYFGLKDLQQFLLIRKMCHDLNFPVKVVGVDTVRNSDGLALSSRNTRLSDNGLKVASNIIKGLRKAEYGIRNGETIAFVKTNITKFYQSIFELEIEYFEIIDPSNLKPIHRHEGMNELAICVAGYVDGIRLIDNLYLRLK